MICLFFLLINLQHAVTIDESLEEKEHSSVSKFDISIYSDEVRRPKKRCKEQGSYLPVEWQKYFSRASEDSGWCYFSYRQERYDEGHVDDTTFQCIKFHIGYPIIRDLKDVEFDSDVLQQIRMTEMQNPLNTKFYEKNRVKQQQMSNDPIIYGDELQTGHKILCGIECYQVAEFIYGKRIAKKILPYLISNGFSFKISQNFVYADGANRYPERSGKMIVIYSSKTDNAKELIIGLVSLLQQLDLDRFEFYHPSEGEIYKGLYTRYGICFTQFPGNFGARGADGRTICRDAEDRIIRCEDGRPFLYKSADGKNRYLQFSRLNSVRFQDIVGRIGATEKSYKVELPGDPVVYSFKNQFWRFLLLIGAVGTCQRVEQSQWVKDFYEDSGISVKSWPDGHGKRLAHEPDVVLT